MRHTDIFRARTTGTTILYWLFQVMAISAQPSTKCRKMLAICAIKERRHFCSSLSSIDARSILLRQKES